MRSSRILRSLRAFQASKPPDIGLRLVTSQHSIRSSSSRFTSLSSTTSTEMGAAVSSAGEGAGSSGILFCTSAGSAAGATVAGDPAEGSSPTVSSPTGCGASPGSGSFSSVFGTKGLTTNDASGRLAFSASSALLSPKPTDSLLCVSCIGRLCRRSMPCTKARGSPCSAPATRHPTTQPAPPDSRCSIDSPWKDFRPSPSFRHLGRISLEGPWSPQKTRCPALRP